MSATANTSKGGEYATARRGGIDQWERDFIRAKRDAGVPDSAIAKMIDRPAQMVRDVPNLMDKPEPIPVEAPPEPARLRAPPAPTPIRPRSPQKSAPRPMPDRVKVIVAWLCAEHGVTLEEMTGPSREPRVVCARQEAYAEIRELKRPGSLSPSYSWNTIGRWFGGRDRTTVSEGVNAHWRRRRSRLAQAQERAA